MKNLTLTLVFFCCVIPAAWTQPKSSSTLGAPAAPPLSRELTEQLQSIRDAALSSDYAWRQLAHLTENIGPRPAGSPQAQAASEYVASEMRNDSLIEMEERANRLPAYLTLPVMLFLMPTIFLVVGGPAALRIMDAFHR